MGGMSNTGQKEKGERSPSSEHRLTAPEDHGEVIRLFLAIAQSGNAPSA